MKRIRFESMILESYTNIAKRSVWIKYFQVILDTHVSKIILEKIKCTGMKKDSQGIQSKSNVHFVLCKNY